MTLLFCIIEDGKEDDEIRLLEGKIRGALGAGAP